MNGKMDHGQDIEQRKEAELEEALRIWTEMRQVDREKGWKRLAAELPESRNRQQRSLWTRRIRAIAAVAVLLLATGIAGWLWMKPEKEVGMQTEIAGNNQPRLILNNGQEILLGSVDTGQSIETTEFVIHRKEKNVVYAGKDSLPEGPLEYNTMEIPRGAEYELILADGTHVWLNADTRLRFPVQFGKDERRVYLEGEAYFEVTKDASRPFRVEAVAQTVEVLGTQFNVYAYRDEENIYTTLVEGKVAVEVTTSGERVVLAPGQQVALNAQTGKAEVREVNIEEAVGWKNGMFVFDDQRLETILRKVARWYNVEILYQNQAAKSLEFKGNLPRYGELPDLLKVLESGSEVHFTLQGQTLMVE